MCHQKYNLETDATQTLQSLEVRTNLTSNRKIAVTDLETLDEKCSCIIISRYRGPGTERHLSSLEIKNTVSA